MKKFITAIAILLAFMLTGCSCNPTLLLSFKNNWASDSITSGYKETLTYDVRLNKNFIDESYDFTQTAGLDEKLTYDFTGTYTVTTEIIGVNFFTKCTSDILSDAKNSSMIKQTTLLDLTATYAINGQEPTSYKDYIKTESYFLTTDISLAPVYAETDSNCTSVTAGPSPTINTQHYTDVTTYTKSGYTTVIKNFEYGKDASTVAPLNETTNSQEYTYRTIIDNTQLLFGIRNLALEKEASKSISVVSSAYNTAQALTIACDAETTTKDFNGVEYPTKRIKFIKASATNTGKNQLVYLQNGAVNDINQSYIIKYVAPLAEYSTTYSCLGALEYTLKTIG